MVWRIASNRQRERRRIMVETNPPKFTYNGTHAFPNWEHLPKHIEPMNKQPMINPARFWLRCIGGVGFFWIIAIIYGVMTT